MSDDGAEVRFKHRGHMRRGRQRTGHVLGNAPPHGVVGHRLYARSNGGLFLRPFCTSGDLRHDVVARELCAAHRNVARLESTLFKQTADAGRKL